jgi:hypothetical protein
MQLIFDYFLISQKLYGIITIRVKVLSALKLTVQAHLHVPGSLKLELRSE